MVELLKKGAAALGVHLSLAQTKQFQRFYEELVDWNSRVNLTSVVESEQVQSRHFLDSLTACLVIPQSLLESGRFVDIGSGGGFPGVPLKIAFPGLKATLVEATSKKAAFLTHLSNALALSDVDIYNGRAETLAHDAAARERYDFAVARAVSSMAALAELMLPFCRLGGLAVAHKRPGVEAELRQAQRAIETMGGELKEVREVAMVELNEPTALVVLEKLGPTPERYPRRPGMPSKRPL
jgi:16S rRNA (guanine527-N7)-methyltransferase